MSTFEMERTVSMNSNYYQHFGIKEIDNIINAEMCNIQCVLETNCDFSTFYAPYGRCQLGLFTGSTTSYGNYGVLETFIPPRFGEINVFL